MLGSEDAIGESKGERRACERGQAALEDDKVFAFLSSKAALARARAFLASSSGPRRGQRGERGRRPAPEGPLSLTRCRREKAKKGVGEFFPLRAEVRAQPTFFSSSSTPTSYFTSPLFFFFFFFFFLFLSEKGGGESSCTLHFTRRAPSWPFLDSSCKSRKAGSKGKKQFSSSSQSV